MSADDRAGLLKKSLESKREAEGDGARTPVGEEHIDRHAFDHPATYETQRIVWIPVDAHGLYKGELEDTRAAGVSHVFFSIYYSRNPLIFLAVFRFKPIHQALRWTLLERSPLLVRPQEKSGTILNVYSHFLYFRS